ncbi:MAG TPA: glycerol kinase GlpK [Gemmatimonadaceae bacterium]|nr:glycerol kinase GlpK [Gemmatimonadaceae bacterium]
MSHVLAIDQGTTGTTCLVVAADGRIIGRAYREVTQHYPRPGWVEHDPDEIIDGVTDAARSAIADAGVTPSAIGITNQRESVVVWDRESGRPVHRAIVWQDRRTTARCHALRPHAAEVTRRTGLVIDPYFSATKLEWLLAHGGGGDGVIARRAERGEILAGTIDSWLLWRLTGGRVHATEPTNASRTMLFDIDAMRWSEQLCAMFGVPMAMLPEVRPSAGVFGTTSAELLGHEIPVAGIAGDQQAALFGQGCWAPGTGKNTYGTGAFLLLNTGTRRPPAEEGLLATVACDEHGRPAYALEAAIFIAGAAVQWLRDGLGLLRTASESETMARSVESTDGVYFVPALVGLGAPDWEPQARGMIVGLTRGTGRAHIVRAALEAMAYSTADVLSVMRERGGVPFERLRVDGGATENDWLMQFQADVLDVAVERPDMIETTALGAAGLAGIATGVWPDAESFLSGRRFRVFAPGEGGTAARAGLAGWRRAVRATLAWARDGR